MVVFQPKTMKPIAKRFRVAPVARSTKRLLRRMRHLLGMRPHPCGNVAMGGKRCRTEHEFWDEFAGAMLEPLRAP